MKIVVYKLFLMCFCNCIIHYKLISGKLYYFFGECFSTLASM